MLPTVASTEASIIRKQRDALMDEEATGFGQKVVDYTSDLFNKVTDRLGVSSGTDGKVSPSSLDSLQELFKT